MSRCFSCHEQISDEMNVIELVFHIKWRKNSFLHDDKEKALKHMRQRQRRFSFVIFCEQL